MKTSSLTKSMAIIHRMEMRRLLKLIKCPQKLKEKRRRQIEQMRLHHKFKKKKENNLKLDTH